MTSIDAGNLERIHAEPVRYPVNLRITVPFPRPFFITLIVGRERRGRERRRAERARHPINTWGNLFTVLTAWTILVTAALFAAFVAATV